MRLPLCGIVLASLVGCSSADVRSMYATQLRAEDVVESGHQHLRLLVDDLRPAQLLAQNRHTAARYQESFQEWKEIQGVSFPAATSRSVDQDTLRLKVFADNVDVIERVQQQLPQGQHFNVGVNSLAALTQEELAHLRGFIPLSENERRRLDPLQRPTSDVRRDDKSTPKTADRVQHVADRPHHIADRLHHKSDSTQHMRGTPPRRNLKTPPDEINWRDLGVMTDVKSQGACGGCWAFAATGLLEATMAIDTGHLVSLSERQLLDCDQFGKNKGCDGGNYYYALQYAASGSGNAISTSKDYPYNDVRATEGSCRVGEQGLVGVTESGLDIRFVDKSEEALKASVAVQPLAVAISGYQPEFIFYDGGVLDTLECGTDVDHAVLLVGYGTTEDGVDYWLIKNSWGLGWGENGYARLARNNAAVMAASNNLGQCGILYQANFVNLANCAVSDCSVYSSRQFCTVERGCLNSTESFSDFIPDSTFSRSIPERESNGLEVPQPVKLASTIAGTVAGCALLVVGALFVREHTHKKKRRDELVARQNKEVLFHGAHLKDSDLTKDPNLQFAVKMDAAEREKQYEAFSKEFFQLVDDPNVERDVVIRYLNGVDGDVKAAAELYLKQGATNRWM